MSQPSEDPTERARRYIAAMEKALTKQAPLKESIIVEASNIARVSDTINRYLQDARFYLAGGKPSTALASVAYAEGLLDALKFLNLTKNGEAQPQ